MIKHFSFVQFNQQSLNKMMDDEVFHQAVTNARSILIQVYSASTQEQDNLEALELLQQTFPTAVIVGATTVGEIVEGQCQTGQQVLGITCFEQSDIRVIVLPIDGDEFEVGQQLGEQIAQQHPDTKGALLLSTPLSIDAASLLKGLERTEPEFEIFGGGAGDYASLNNSHVFSERTLYDKGIVAVLFSGTSLHIDSRTYLGWRSLSRTMRVTKADQMVVDTIDDKPAFEVYRKYLNVRDDDDFFLNALEFPLLIERHGRMLARVPVGVTETGGLVFVADIEPGETFRLGYGDPKLIVDDAKDTLDNINRFNPEVVFLYSCGCRRFLMQEDVDLETQPIEAIAPTFGFYTYGEFFSDKGKLPLLNSTLVAVSMKEHDLSQDVGTELPKAPPQMPMDPYANKHARIISRLVQFISATTEELELANEAKSQFLANTTHELRTPLTSIMGYAEGILTGDINDQEQREAVEVIHKQSKNLVSLINDILDISKIEAREMEVEIADCTIIELVSELKSTFAHQAKQKHLIFEVDIEPNFPAVIQTDGARLRQILVNLCGNAIKFTGSGSVKVAICYSQSLQMLEVKVVDTGIGMNASQVKSVFTPFAQVKHQQNGKPHGTGLGLSISKELTQLLGGSLSVCSELGKGSTFTLELPAPQANHEQGKVSNNRGSFDASKKRGGLILLAEDSIENGNLFKLFLENAGLKVDLVEDGTQALDKVMSTRYELILLDIQMPIMNGLETFELLKSCGIETKVVALTANASSTDIAHYLSMGFCDCIAKPVNKEDLVQSVWKHIDESPIEQAVEFDPTLYRALATSSVTTMKEDAKTLMRLFESNDLQGLSKLAHKLKGLAGQFDHHQIAKLSGKIERTQDAIQIKETLLLLTAKIENL